MELRDSYKAVVNASTGAGIISPLVINPTTQIGATLLAINTTFGLLTSAIAGQMQTVLDNYTLMGNNQGMYQISSYTQTSGQNGSFISSTTEYYDRGSGQYLGSVVY
jgi:hypothetical protein